MRGLNLLQLPLTMDREYEGLITARSLHSIAIGVWLQQGIDAVLCRSDHWLALRRRNGRQTALASHLCPSLDDGEGKDPSSDASRLFAVEMKRLYKTV